MCFSWTLHENAMGKLSIYEDIYNAQSINHIQLKYTHLGTELVRVPNYAISQVISIDFFLIRRKRQANSAQQNDKSRETTAIYDYKQFDNMEDNGLSVNTSNLSKQDLGTRGRQVREGLRSIYYIPHNSKAQFLLR